MSRPPVSDLRRLILRLQKEGHGEEATKLLERFFRKGLGVQFSRQSGDIRFRRGQLKAHGYLDEGQRALGVYSLGHSETGLTASRQERAEQAGTLAEQKANLIAVLRKIRKSGLANKVRFEPASGMTASSDIARQKMHKVQALDTRRSEEQALAGVADHRKTRERLAELTRQRRKKFNETLETSAKARVRMFAELIKKAGLKVEDLYEMSLHPLHLDLDSLDEFS